MRSSYECRFVTCLFYVGDDCVKLEGKVRMFFSLFLVCELAGVGMICGAIWLLYKQVIRLESKDLNDLTYGKFALKTSPAVLFFVVAAALIVIPVYLSKDIGAATKYLRAEQDITSTNVPIEIYAVVNSTTLPNPGKLVIMFPLINAPTYIPEIWYWPCGAPRPEKQVVPLEGAKNGVVVLPAKTFQYQQQCQLYSGPVDSSARVAFK
jgi:hypothetical protein